VNANPSVQLERIGGLRLASPRTALVVGIVSVPLSLPFTLAMLILAWRIWQEATAAGPVAPTALAGP
jgi:TRAP-type C4-dicarboxylate transport system permease small subunit